MGWKVGQKPPQAARLPPLLYYRGNMNASKPEHTIWDDILSNLEKQMTQATFATWLYDSHLVDLADDHLLVAVRNTYAVDWLSNRLQDTVLRTAARVLGRPVEVSFVVASNGTGDDDEADVDPSQADIRPDSRIAIELVNFDLRDRGFVIVPNYVLQYWQPYLAAVERETGARNTGIAFYLWNTLRSFPAAWDDTRRPHWPTICTLADMVARGNRHKLIGRNAHGQKRRYTRMVGALEILQNERIVWSQPIGTGRDTVYYFKVLDKLPLLTPIQVGKLSTRLQERHAREIERCRLEFEEWQQLSLPTLLRDEE